MRYYSSVMHTLRNEWLILLVGDLIALILSLYFTLVVRYQQQPTLEFLSLHALPFGLLFVVSIGIFFISGLYDRQTLFTQAELPGTIFAAQVTNVLLAALMFFFIPVFSIAPKTNLVIYLFVSTVCIVIWRTVIVPFLRSRSKVETALIIGETSEVNELTAEINANDRYGFTCLSPVNIDSTLPEELPQVVAKRLASDAPTVLIANLRDTRLRSILPHVFGYTFANPHVTFVSLNDLYENIFERVTLSSLNFEWYLEHASRPQQVAYDVVKRGIDILLSIVILFFLLCMLPFIWLLMRLEGRGSLFIKQNRIGRHTQPMSIQKIRTMERMDEGAWYNEASENKHTKVGNVLRATSIDELPQVFSVLAGKLSLIGPRSDVVALGERLQEAIPFYTIRYSVTPGITGWAQTHQRYAPGQINPQSIEDSKVRLQYDLYYIKHRSLLLDISIALRTIKTLVSRLIPRKK